MSSEKPNYKCIPHSASTKEDKILVDENDRGVSSKTGRNLDYKELNKISNGVDEEEKIADLIDNKALGDNKVESVKEKYSKAEIIKQQIINDIKSKEKIGFLQKNKSVAHIGPEFANQEEVLHSEDNNIETIEGPEDEVLTQKIKNFENKPFFLPNLKALKDKISAGFFYRKETKTKKQIGKGHDKILRHDLE